MIKVISLDLTNVRFSKRDREKGITIPKFLTPELAEDIGIHLGDGSLYRCNHKKSSHEFAYSFNIDEKDYALHVLKLKKKLYNLQKFRLIKGKGKELRLLFNSIAITTFYTSVFNIPVGSKTYTCKVPDIIKRSNDMQIIASCIRGIVDTDFWFGFKHKYGKLYPVLSAYFASPFIVKDLSDLFALLGIENYLKFNQLKNDKRFKEPHISHEITINGYKRINKYLKLVGFNNSKNVNYPALKG